MYVYYMFYPRNQNSFLAPAGAQEMQMSVRLSDEILYKLRGHPGSIQRALIGN